MKETSLAAYRSMKVLRAPLRREVFNALLNVGEHGATREELCQSLGMSGSTLRPRVWELMKHDPPLIVEGPQKRLTTSGREAFVLKVKHEQAEPTA